MRVVHIFGGGVHSGVERHILTLTKAMQSSGIECLLAPLNNRPARGDYLPYVHEVIPSDKKFRGDFSFIWRLARRIQEANVDIVHTHSYDGNFYGARASRLAGAKHLVNTVHTFEFDAMADVYESRLVRAIVCRQNRRLIRSASRVIVVCGPLRDRLVHDGIDPERIRVIRNGIDLTAYPFPLGDTEGPRKEFGLPAEKALVGTVGRIAPVKNIGLFLRVARSILDHGGDAHFLIIGDGPLRAKMEGLRRELGLTGKVTFAGFQPDTRRMISMLDVFVLCSQTETSSYALLEASALAKPIVATAVGGNVDIIGDEQTGVLVPPGDVGATSAAITRLLNDRRRAEELGRAARESLRTEFDARTMARETLALYCELMPESLRGAETVGTGV